MFGAALLVVGAGRAAFAGPAPVRAPLAVPVPAMPALAIAATPVPQLCPGLALSRGPGLAALALPPAAPPLVPAALDAATGRAERRHFRPLERLATLAEGLAADSRRPPASGQARLAAFFDASKTGAAPTPSAGEPAVPADYLPLPVTVQETNYSCGAAAALSVLRYWRAYGGDERSLYELFGTTPKDGSPPQNITQGLRRLGLRAEMRESMTLEDLRAALRRGDSVILDIQAWRDDENTPWAERWEDGHYVALVGMDERYAYLMDPSTPDRYAYVPLAELLDRWHDYEDRDGPVRRYVHLGIIARGERPLPRPTQPPAAPEPIQ